MTVKHALKLTFCGLMITLLSVQASAFNHKNPAANDYLEPQMVDPAKDKIFLGSIGMNVNLANEPILNIMFLAQDKRGPSYRAKLNTLRDNNESTKGLASRSDIINVISLNRHTGKWSIYALYRGMNTPSACGGSLSAEENYLTNYYSEYGRRFFIPCVESIMQGAINRHPRLAEIYGGRAFKVHGFIEGTKEETLDGLTTAIAKTVVWNSFRLTGIYTTDGLRKGMSMFMNSAEAKRLLSGQEEVKGDVKVKVDTDYIYVEAKERYIYPAGGYQRSFNFARVLADALGWIGYGVYHDAGLPSVFAHIFDGHFSRTFALKDFMAASTLADGKSGLGNAAYRNGMSPVTIVQFGPGIGSYSVFQNNQFAHYGGNGTLQQLKPEIVGSPGTELEFAL